MVHAELGTEYRLGGLETVFETERLIIADWRGDELPLFRRIAADPEVMRYIGTGDPWSDTRIAGFIDRQLQRGLRREIALWKLVERESGELIGLCGLQPLLATEAVEIGWWLTPSRWGRGLATEAASRLLRFALESLPLPRVVAITQVPNIRSQHVAARIGLRYVGTIPFGDLGGEPSGIPIAFFSSDGSFPESVRPGSHPGDEA